MLAKSILSIALLASLSAVQAGQWCAAQITTCSTLCSSNTIADSCDPTSLGYTCICANGSTPGLLYYTNSMPSLICEQIFQNCILEGENDAAAQAVCNNNEKNNCGHLDPDNFKAASAAATSITSFLLVPSSSPSSVTAKTFSSIFVLASATQTQTSSSSGIFRNSTTATVSQSISTNDNAGLSTGAKSRIGVGAAVIGILMLGGGAFFFYQKGKKAASKPPQVPELGVESWNRAEMGDGFSPSRNPQEKPRRGVSEMAGNSHPRGNLAEIGVGGHLTTERAELESKRK